MISDILSDPELFFSALLKIRDKNGDIVSFNMNDEQKEFLKAYMSGDENILIVKSRQIGVSTIITALLFWEWYTTSKSLSLFSMAHTATSTRNMMAMLTTYYDNLPKQFQRPLSVRNSNTLTLADTGATITARTAGSKGGTRSFSCNIAHLSEFAFFENPEELMASLIPALNNGRLIIESTPNFYGDALHLRALQALEGGPYKLLFFPWYAHKEYRLETQEGHLNERDDIEIQRLYNLDNEQLAWRRKKISEMGVYKFKRDYPATLDEAYSQGSLTWLTEKELEHISPIVIKTNDYTWEEPNKDFKYAIGVDTSLGVGRDYSWIWVVNCNTRTIAATWFSNTIKPSDLAVRIQMLSKKYNDALTLVESNNTGHSVILALTHNGFLKFWKDENNNDWLTTSKTKPEIMENLRKEISNKNITQLDHYTLAQLKGLQVDKGRIIFPSHQTGHFDSVIALALAFTCCNSVSIPVKNIAPFTIRKQQQKPSWKIR